MNVAKPLGAIFTEAISGVLAMIPLKMPNVPKVDMIITDTKSYALFEFLRI